MAKKLKQYMVVHDVDRDKLYAVDYLNRSSKIPLFRISYDIHYKHRVVGYVAAYTEQDAISYAEQVLLKPKRKH